MEGFLLGRLGIDRSIDRSPAQKARVLIPFPLHVYLGTFRSKHILISKHTPAYFCISQNALLFYMPEIPLMFLFISLENALSSIFA